MPALVTLTQDRHATTTSLVVAEKFGKQHKDVLRAIEKVIADCPDPEFSRRNFAPSTYVSERGKIYPLYDITKDGFSLLAMGFTGPQALQWKISFLEAFNALESAWKELPMVQLALRERRVLDLAQAQNPVGQGYIRGILSFPRQAYENSLDMAEKLLAEGRPIYPEAAQPNHYVRRKLKTGQREALSYALEKADSEEQAAAIVESHARRLGLSPKRLMQLFNSI